MTPNLKNVFVACNLCDQLREAYNQNPTKSNWQAFNDMEGYVHDIIDALTPAEWAVYEKVEEQRRTC